MAKRDNAFPVPSARPHDSYPQLPYPTHALRIPMHFDAARDFLELCHLRQNQRVCLQSCSPQDPLVSPHGAQHYNHPLRAPRVSTASEVFASAALVVPEDHPGPLPPMAPILVSAWQVSLSLARDVPLLALAVRQDRIAVQGIASARLAPSEQRLWKDPPVAFAVLASCNRALGRL